MGSKIEPKNCQKKKKKAGLKNGITKGAALYNFNSWQDAMMSIKGFPVISPKNWRPLMQRYFDKKIGSNTKEYAQCVQFCKNSKRPKVRNNICKKCQEIGAYDWSDAQLKLTIES